jgi:hypothetical protein
MTLAEAKDWADIISKLAIPFVLAGVGLKLVRSMEAAKAEVSRASDFSKKWADAFFDASNQYLNTTERYAAILNFLQSLSNPNTPFGTKLQEEASEYNVRLGELGLRVERFAYYAPKAGPEAHRAAKELLGNLGAMVTNRKGSFEQLVALQNSFSRAAHRAHAEMLQKSIL